LTVFLKKGYDATLFSRARCQLLEMKNHGSWGGEMPQLMRYGTDSTLRIDLPDDIDVTDCTAPHGVPLDDPVAAVAAALADPLNFPALSRAVVPGDRVVLALDGGVPQSAAAVAAVVHTLMEGRIEPHDITILRTMADARAGLDPVVLLAPHIREAIRVEVHDPSDTKSLAYLAASKDGQPIYFNRTICDADVVLPIGAVRLDWSLGYAGIHGGLFPTFSNDATQQRFCTAAADWAAQQRRHREEADEAAWLLGVQFTLQIVPGPRNSVLHVLAGDANTVNDRGRQLCEMAWHYRIPRRASLVVATIEGGEDQQTWENFARALFAASRAVADDGAIVLCTELQCQPGPALKRLASPAGIDAAMRAIRREHTADAVSASLLAEAQQRARVYLLSRLSDEVVEDMGLGYVGRAEEIGRLSRQHDSCILVGNAQYALVTSQEDESLIPLGERDC
jgi:nickel-dependent lactate racemase